MNVPAWENGAHTLVTCECSAVGGTYYLEAVAECYGELRVDDVVPCRIGETPILPSSLSGSFAVYCVTEGDGSIILGIEVQLALGSEFGDIGVYRREVSVAAPVELPLDCAALLNGPVPLETAFVDVDFCIPPPSVSVTLDVAS